MINSEVTILITLTAVMQRLHAVLGGASVLFPLLVINFGFVDVYSMVSSYLVHHGYCATAMAFARATETMIQEDQTSIKNRQSKTLRHLINGIRNYICYREFSYTF